MEFYNASFIPIAPTPTAQWFCEWYKINKENESVEMTYKRWEGTEKSINKVCQIWSLWQNYSTGVSNGAVNNWIFSDLKTAMCTVTKLTLRREKGKQCKLKTGIGIEQTEQIELPESNDVKSSSPQCKPLKRVSQDEFPWSWKALVNFRDLREKLTIIDHTLTEEESLRGSWKQNHPRTSQIGNAWIHHW